MSQSQPNVAGTLWDTIGPWLDAEGIRLRPWQEQVARRAYEVDGDGKLVWRTIVVSTPRQSGKSVLLKAMALARGAHPGLFGGEPQKVIHAANQHLAARRIHSQAWSWAAGHQLVIRKAAGMERIIWPDESSWDALTLSSVYGESANVVMLDEVWDVSPEDYREGLRPTQVARTMPQLWALSTAHRRATGLMLELMEQGRRGEGRVLVVDWGAPEGADPLDPATWRAASPHWDDQRAEEMSLVAGQPGFAEQWLNVWPTPSVDVLRWLPKVMTDRARGRVGDAPSEAVCAVEVAPDSDGWAVAAAWPHTRNRIRARVWQVPDAHSADLAVGDRRVLAHQAVAAHPDLARRHVEVVSVPQARAATAVLRDALAAHLLTVAGVDDDTWAGLRTMPADGGEVISPRRSSCPVQGVKALSWAVWAVRSAEGQTGLVM